MGGACKPQGRGMAYRRGRGRKTEKIRVPPKARQRRVSEDTRVCGRGRRIGRREGEKPPSKLGAGGAPAHRRR